MGALSLITMNCLGLPLPLPGVRTRLRALGNALAASKVDVACLQEVGRWQYLPLLRTDEETWPHVLARPLRYAPRGGLLLMSQLPVVGSAYHTFIERGSMTSLHVTERYQRKGILEATLMVGGRTVMIFNTHLAANYTARWTRTNPFAKVEQAQLQELATRVQVVPEEVILLVAGDFNIPRHSWLYDEFRDLTGLIDPLAGSTVPTYRPPRGIPDRAAQPLDHILIRAPRGLTIHARVERCFGELVQFTPRTQGFLSDHWGLRVWLEWEEDGGP